MEDVLAINLSGQNSSNTFHDFGSLPIVQATVDDNLSSGESLVPLVFIDLVRITLELEVEEVVQSQGFFYHSFQVKHVFIRTM